jgi:hypothetical protein
MLSNPEHSIYHYSKQEACSYFDMKYWRGFLTLGYPVVLPATKIQWRFKVTFRKKEADNQDRQLQNGVNTIDVH